MKSFIKQIVPIAAFGVALAGAFGTNAMERNQKASGPIQGFSRLNLAGDCGELHTSCETENTGNVCMINATTQAWAKTLGNKCTVEVYRPE